jgi:hypothetical protein
MQRTLAAATAAAPAARAAALSSRARVAPLAAPTPRHAAPLRAVRTYAGVADTVKEKIASSPVVVFSKSYCRALRVSCCSATAPRARDAAGLRDARASTQARVRRHTQHTASLSRRC